jgi:hypothetical protein
VPLVEEALDVEMVIWPIDPVLEGVDEATFSIRGKRRVPEPPGDPPRNGLLEKRKHVLRGFSFASFQFAQELAAALYANRQVLINVNGAKLYYGKAVVGPLCWYDARHSTPEAELSDIAELDGNERAAELLKRIREGEDACRTKGLGVRSID